MLLGMAIPNSSSCYERHELTSYVCTEVTALDKIQSGKRMGTGDF